ncbi:MAG: P-II family nitrogen regulator [Bacteroidales bacterium]|nr:P-II family nitrogen regulator [Bacteroidales bacterium]
MKLVKAYIRHRMVEEVHHALIKGGYCCMTFVECEGTGQYTDHEKEHISDKYPFAEAYRVIKIEILSRDEDVENLVKLIRENGRTGYRGDGMIIISPVEETYKIRTDDKGVEVI